jgi:ribosomal protein S18 acetylase RimI-like enzyme
VTDSPVRLATEADRARVLETVVAAFVADPAFRHFFADDARYAQEAASFAGALFDQRLRYETVWVADGGAAVSMWNPPAIGAGAAAEQLAFDLPAETVARLARYEDAVHELFPAQPHWYLGVLATHPDHAGRRLGRLVMAAGQERAAADGLPAYLETSSESNVALYERSGWQRAGVTEVDGLTVNVMMRSPGAGGDASSG